MSELQDLEISPSLKLKCNIISALLIVLAGVFLLLCGLDVFPLQVSGVLLATIFTTLFLIFMIDGILKKNPITTFIASCFLVAGVVEVLAVYSTLTRGDLYSLYIAMCGIACLINAILNLDFKTYILPILFFLGLGGIFALHSFGILALSIVIPIVIVYLGLCILIATLKLHAEKDEKDEEEKE